MKKRFFALCAAVMCIIMSVTSFASGEVSVYVNGNKIEFDVAPQQINGRTMVPMRAIFEELGASVSWNSDTGTVIGTKDSKTVIMQVDNKMIVSNNNVSTLDVAPAIIDGRTLVPVRAVAEGLDVNVVWDEEKNSVIITEFDKSNYNESRFGSELASSSGWTSVGWNGNFKDGFSHIVGETTPLVYKMPEKTGTNLYQIEFDVANCSKSGVPNASTAFSVIIGNSEPFITYNGGGPRHYSFGIRSKENGDLKIVLTKPADPSKTDNSFDGTIKNISVKRIVESFEPNVKIVDSNDKTTLEVRANNQKNIYIGNNAGSLSTSGELNVGIGENSLKNNTSGYWNTAIGAQSLENNTVGSRNVAIGRLAMNENISGDRNYAIGTFALMRNTTGRFNIAIGADALWCNTSGDRNIAFGSASLATAKESSDNIAMGHDAMAGRTNGSGNIAIGTYSQYGAGQSKGNIALGMYSQYKGGGGDFNISIGNTSGNNMTVVKDDAGKITDSATSNVGVGYGTLSKTTTGKYNVSVGHLAGSNNETANNNVYVGMFSGKSSTGASNTFVGAYSGEKTTTGTNNIMLGYRTEPSSPTSSYELNVGNTIYGNLKEGSISIGKRSESGAVLEIKGGDGKKAQVVLIPGKLSENPVDGALEFDGENLYFTNNGKREKVMFESDIKKMIEEALNK